MFGDHALRIHDDRETRAILILHISAGQYGRTFNGARPGVPGAAVTRRLFR